MQKTSYYIINTITVYRLVAAFLLLYLVFAGREDIFKWMLAISFFTDAIDGFLARKYKVVSVMGSRIDSVADDLTILVAMIAVLVLKMDFIRHELVWIIVLLALYFIQTISALVRYGKISSFHTYTAKFAAVLQGIFLILLFFLPEPPFLLFRVMAIVTMLDIIEEIVLVAILPQWKADVKGLYWVLKRKN